MTNQRNAEMNVTDEEFDSVLNEFNEQRNKLDQDSVEAANKINEILTIIRECKAMLKLLLESRT